MGINVMFHDERLSGDSPLSVGGILYNHRFRVNSSSRLRTDVVDRCLMLGRLRSGGMTGQIINRIAILCHGYEVGGELGYGLEFCEDLSISTYSQLERLSLIQINEIFIYGCGAAHIATGTAGREVDGNGHILCSNIARTANTYLSASTEAQNCDNGIPGLYSLNMGGWEGLVVRYDSSGNLTGPGTRYDRDWFSGWRRDDM